MGKLRTGTRLPVSETVKLGISSSVRSVEIFSSPVKRPAWLSNAERSREMGIHESSSLLKRLMTRRR
jgi:hypothetical protein